MQTMFGTSEREDGSPKVLSYLDAYACLPWPAHTPKMLTRVNAVQSLLEGLEATKDAIMARTSELFAGKLNERAILLAYKRLLFYRAHAQGKSFVTIKAELLTAHESLGLPHNFSASRVSADIIKQTPTEIDELYALSATFLDKDPEAIFKSQERMNHLESVLE
jgi:hypothetical protein